MSTEELSCSKSKDEEKEEDEEDEDEDEVVWSSTLVGRSRGQKE